MAKLYKRGIEIEVPEEFTSALVKQYPDVYSFEAPGAKKESGDEELSKVEEPIKDAEAPADELMEGEGEEQLKSMTREDLLEFAKSLSLEATTRTSKADLIELIKNYQNTAE